MVCDIRREIIEKEIVNPPLHVGPDRLDELVVLARRGLLPRREADVGVLAQPPLAPLRRLGLVGADVPHPLPVVVLSLGRARRSPLLLWSGVGLTVKLFSLVKDT